MTALFVDTSVFLLAVGGPHAQRDACREFLQRAAGKQTTLHSSVETVQEYGVPPHAPRAEALAAATLS